jgi:GDP-mannose 6-dehydrogenase
VKAIAGDEFGQRITLALNPEFLREGAAVRDFEEPELVVYATEHEPAARLLERMHEEHSSRVVRADPSTAEVLKLVCNAWHALKVSFANEVARIAAPVGVDARAVMALLCRDTRLNTSAAYLRPGLPFGGACLVKDVASLTTHARTHNVNAPLISSVIESNEAHIAYCVRSVLEFAPRRVAVVGIGFKPGAADVRDSAPVRLVAALLDAGVSVSVADSGVLAATIPPLGIDALRSALGDPRAEAADSVARAVDGADAVVAAHPSPADARALAMLSLRIPVLDAAGELARVLSRDELHALHVVDLLRGKRSG